MKFCIFVVYYSVFTDKPVHNCYFLAPSRIVWLTAKWHKIFPIWVKHHSMKMKWSFIISGAENYVLVIVVFQFISEHSALFEIAWLNSSINAALWILFPFFHLKLRIASIINKLLGISVHKMLIYIYLDCLYSLSSSLGACWPFSLAWSFF